VTTLHALTWRLRAQPLPVCGVLLRGDSSRTFSARVADRNDVASSLRLAVGDGYLVAVGDASDLPWVDGAVWLGRDGPILCPTTLQPDMPSALVAGALMRNGHRGLVVATPAIAFVSDLPAGPPSTAQLVQLAQGGAGL